MSTFRYSATSKSVPVTGTSASSSKGKGRAHPIASTSHQIEDDEAAAYAEDVYEYEQGQEKNQRVNGKGKERETIVIDSDDDDEGDSDVEMERVQVGAGWDATMMSGHGENGAGSKNGVDMTEEDEQALAKLDDELVTVKSQLSELESYRQSLEKDRTKLLSEIRSRSRQVASEGSKKATVSGAIDYERGENFQWTKKVDEIAKKVWGIKEFRMCQRGAINASLDGRDCVVVMPTGGGKSLIYQLPALLQKTTVVVTPLISLMQDQAYNLRKVGVRVETLNAATSQDDARDILKRMVNGAGAAPKVKGKKSAKADMDLEVVEDEREIKLVYVTPEKVDKSKTFISTLQKMYDSGALSRIVIDEAHCTSSLGHDYRTSYLCLGKLKSLFPKTPIVCLTATAPEAVITDMLKILVLPKTTSPGDAAIPRTTVLFTAPLYRSNLHYSFLPKPSSAPQVIQSMVDYILESHLGETGIIYCLSRADTENVAKGIKEKSGGKIRAAVYHSYIADGDKLAIHKAWRNKTIHVVVATIAFGLGIDAPDVRFVLHHTISKSIEGYYQESGRAGRDGKDSDCVVWYRSADASRLSTLIFSEFFSGGKEKLYQVLAMAEDLEGCRKLAFADYFASTHSSKSAFESGTGQDDPCGHCDNCQRDPSTFERIDSSEHVYRTLRVIDAAVRKQGTLTLMQASDLVRGLGGGSFSVQAGKNKGKGKIDVKEVAGDKLKLPKDETESLLINLLLEEYLQEEFYNTAYTTLSYLKPSPRAYRFSKLTPDEFAKSGTPVKMEMAIRVAGKKKRKSGEKATGAKKKARISRLDTATASEGGSEGEGNEDQGVEEEEDDDDYGDVEEEEPGPGDLLPSDGSEDHSGWQVWKGKEENGVVVLS